MTEPSKSKVICAACSTPGNGRFCSSCGASLEASTCVGCGAPLTPGARFCHSCRRPVGNAISPASSPAQPAQRASAATPLPWIVAAIALIALFALFASNAFSKRNGIALDAPQNALPQAGLDGRGILGGTPAEGAARLPDISQLSPQELADRLFNRVMFLAEQGKTDSVLFFAPMAIQTYQTLSQMNADQRYDMGRIAEVSGALPLAKAQADTILRENPTHLLGLILAAQIASLEKDAVAQKKFAARILSAYDSESAKRLPEYERHAGDITTALADARRSTGGTR